ncbi:MAG: hypothetical protein QF384_06400 [Alphaproteobacteria bacterium]|jgi:hypothetical protein|nr:hypothetical protein [Alphaproteobacteria bacterium]MDP6875863.1 hypothetical protein [Alphaproteobacteria bacterium]
MSDDKGSSLSAAFDALLDKNWQRLDALSGSSPKTAVQRPVDKTVPTAKPSSGDRRTGRSDGRDFSFDL